MVAHVTTAKDNVLYNHKFATLPNPKKLSSDDEEVVPPEV